VEFEWDPHKAEANLAKHGVGFEDATLVFDDPFHLVLSISALTANGDIGAVNGRILFVAYTMRGHDVCRVISARRASRRERSTYSLPPGP
jgi:uncharacterized DUF497 family protein